MDAVRRSPHESEKIDALAQLAGTMAAARRNPHESEKMERWFNWRVR